MLYAVIAIISFLSGALCAVYCLRLGMTWAGKQHEEPAQELPLIPFERPPGPEPEQQKKKTDPIVQWMVGDSE